MMLLYKTSCMKLLTLVIFTLLTFHVALAQNKAGSIKGKVFDAANRQPLPSATITVVTKDDSTAAGYAVADKTGVFEIKNLPVGSYIVGITFTGYGQVIKDINITAARPVINLDTIKLKTDTTMLASVVVMQPPIIINKDTVEFMARSFKTKPNATVEDLLKKLPGVEVDKDGNITAQGEAITKIYVNGKEFFTNDPKLASKNLTAELVESIQVFDDMSDQAKFTHIDDGSRTRTINIKLRKDRSKGIFGRTNIGAGSSDRYEGSTSFNKFNDIAQLSILGGANNVNHLGFTSNDLISSIGGMTSITGGGGGGGLRNRNGGGGGGRGGGGRAPARPASASTTSTNNSSAPNGNTESWNGGFNFRDQIGTKLQIAGNYFISHTTTINRGNSYQQNKFPNDSASYVADTNYNMNSSLSHRIGMRIEYTIDSMNSLLMTPVFSAQHSTSEYDDSSLTRSVNPTLSYTAIKAQNTRMNERDGWSVNNNLLFRHRFKKLGRTFTIGWTTTANKSNGSGNNLSPYYFYNPEDTTSYFFQDVRRQNDQSTHAFNNTISTSFTNMVGSTGLWEVNYAYSNNKSVSDKNTYDYNLISGKYDNIDSSQTNNFENSFISSRLGTNFRVRKEKYDFQLGGAVQFAQIKSDSYREITGKDSLLSQRYTNFFPNASFNYNLGTRKSLRFNYRGNTVAPSINQLQDIPDETTNILSWTIGNPKLKQEFDHTINFSYNTFNLSNFLYLNINLQGTLSTNKIVSFIDSAKNSGLFVPDSLKNYTIYTKPINLNGSGNVSLGGTIGIPLKKVATGKRSPINLNLSTTARYARNVSMYNQQLNVTYTSSLTERINYNMNVKEKLDITANAAFSYNNNRNNLTTTLNNTYFTQEYTFDISYIFFKNLEVSSDFDDLINAGLATGFNQSVPLWNASAAYLLFKKKNGEIRFSVYDILNQNKSITRTTTSTYIRDTYTQVLQRFFLVSFMYNLNRFGGKSQGRNNNNGFPRDRNGGGGGGNFRGGGGGGGRRG